MKLRIILPTLGTSRYLAETFTGIQMLAERMDVHAVVVVPSEKRLVVPDCGKFVIVNEPAGFSGGLYGAINLGIRQPGEWTHMTYINDDDGYIGQWKYRDFEDADISYGRVLLRYTGSCKEVPLTVCREPTYLPSVWSWKAPGLYQQGTIIKRKVYEAVGGFDTSYRLAADHAFWLKAWRLGARFCFRDEVVAFFRLRAGQLSGNREKMMDDIVGATAENGMSVGKIERISGYIYWRLQGVGSLMSRISLGLPWRVKPGE